MAKKNQAKAFQFDIRGILSVDLAKKKSTVIFFWNEQINMSQAHISALEHISLLRNVHIIVLIRCLDKRCRVVTK